MPDSQRTEQDTAIRRSLFDRPGSAGLRTTGPRPDWQIRPVGTLPLGDARVRTGDAGSVVEPPETTAGGAPAFGYATGPGGADDHLKWCALVAHTASSGLPGFDAPGGGELVGAAELAVRVFGAERHPFGDAVAEPQADPRLGAGALLALDRETGLVFDFFVSNRHIHAVYERLPRPGTGWAAFTYLVPVAERTPDLVRRLEIGLDRDAGTVRWSVDGEQVLSVARLGHLSLPRTHLVIDHGGTEESAVPRQLAFGLGLFTLLDAAGPDGRGLVRLSAERYYDPARGAPAPQRFRDELGLRANRLWGQGVRLTVRRVTVTTGPAPGSP
ncbi:DUF6081 family protein [Embleya sp. NPDC020886]|uniref:DUF6081 family protein n=1 Tax=Embleya sp. NPDC020886 TaxID=3363980 RepID=UPI00378A0C0C